MECKLCLKKSEQVIPLFAKTVIALIEDLTDVKLVDHDKQHAMCCKTCLMNLKRACDLKRRLLRLYKASLQKCQQKLTANQDSNKMKIEFVSVTSNSKTETDNINIKKELIEESEKLDTNSSPKTKSVSNVSKLHKQPDKTTNDKIKLKVLNCEQCEMNFKNRKEFNAHMMKHKLKKCPVCTASIRSDNFKRHFELHSAGTEVCEICGKVAKNKESLRGHMFHQHKHNADTYKCELCESRFRYKYRYSLHMQKVHVGERNHQCEICGKKFFTLYDIRKHKDMTHLKRRPYICTYCLKGFSSRYALKTHIRQHTHETPFKCDICAEGFRQKVSLRTHLKSKHHIVVVNMEISKNMEEQTTKVDDAVVVDVKENIE